MLRLALCLFFTFAASCANYAGGDHQHQRNLGNPDDTPLSLHRGQGLSLKMREDGTLFAAWAHGNHVYLQRSANMGESWSNPLVVNAAPLPIRAGGENRIGLALGHSDEVFICFVHKLPQKWTSNLMFTRSTDGGLSFEPVRQINDDQDVSSHAFPVMDTAADGILVLVWIDGRDRLQARRAGQKTEGLSLYGVRSHDSGKTFASNQQLVTGTCQCCRLALAFNRNQEPVVLWRHIFADHTRDHAFGVWGAQGLQQWRSSHEQWQFMGCPHQGPALIRAKKGGFFAAWYSVINDAPTTFFAHLDAKGKQTTKPLSIRSGMHPALLEHEDKLYFVWLEPLDTGMGLFGRTMTLGNWSERQLLAKGEVGFDHPHLLTKANTVYWAWQIDGQLQLKAVAMAQ